MNNLMTSAILYMTEAVILWFYANQIFVPRLTRLKSLLLTVIGYIPAFIVFQFHQPMLNAILFSLTNVVILYAAQRCQLTSALFHGALTTAAMALSDILAVRFLSGTEAVYHDIMTQIAGKLLYLLLLQIIAIFFRKIHIDKSPSLKGDWLLTISSMFSLLLIGILALIRDRDPLGLNLDILIAAATLLSLLLNILLAGQYIYMQKKNMEYLDMQLQFQHEQISTEYQRQLLHEDEQQKILIHDIRKHLRSLSALCLQKDIAKVQAYVESIIDSPALATTIRFSDNELLNILLSRYKKLAEKQQTNLHIDIRKQSTTFLSPDELTALFCNLLDNALTATKDIADSFIELSATRKESADLTVITMINTCPEDPFSPETGELIQRYEPSSMHGYGLKSVKKITAEYDGLFQIYYKETDHTFHTVITLREPKHS